MIITLSSIINTREKINRSIRGISMKELNKDNYFSPEEYNKLRYKFNTETSQVEPMIQDDYIILANDFIIEPYVPEFIINKYNKIRNTFAYGYLDHSNFTSAYEESLIAFESAIDDVYDKVNGPKKTPEGNRAYAKYKAKYLMEHDYLPQSLGEEYFIFLVNERNKIAHININSQRNILDLAMAHKMILAFASFINTMYSKIETAKSL